MYLFCYDDRVVYFGGSEAPFLYMTLMYQDTTFWTYVNEITYDDWFIILFTCVNVFECFMACETNANLVHSQHMNQKLD